MQSNTENGQSLHLCEVFTNSGVEMIQLIFFFFGRLAYIPYNTLLVSRISESEGPKMVPGFRV